MSKIKVNSLEGVGASTPAISIDNASGTCTANITNNLSNRNLIINGAMQVAQRGTSFTASGSYPVDRFRPQWGGADENPTVAQVDVASGTTPYTLGFRKAIKITNGDQSSGAGTGDYLFIRYKVEAQDLAQSGWNYTSATSYITLSFWVKSSVPQTFQCRLETQDGTKKNYPFETGSLSQDTWTKVTKTIPGNSGIQIDNDDGCGVEIWWELFRGTGDTDNSVTNEAWGDPTTNRTKDQTPTWWTTDNATYEITGVQLEVGSVATDFEHLSFADELRRCQRYYETTYPYGVAIGGTNSYTGMITQSGSTNGSATMIVSVFWNEKRTTPTVTAYNPVNGNSGTWYAHRSGSTTHASVTIDQTSKRRCRLYFGVGANWEASNAEGHVVVNSEL